MKRVISIFLAAMLIVSLLPAAAFAAEYTDTQGHWGERPIDRWSDYGVVTGKGNGIFDPNGPMTRGEAAQVFANLFRLTAKADLSGYTDVGLGMWYDDAIAKCVKAGIMSGKGDGVMDPEGTITREEFFVMFANALGIKPETTAEVAVADSAQASSWAADYITALVNKGYVNGTSSVANGIVVQPKLNINRASVMALLDKTITTYVNTSEAVTAGDGLVLIVCDDADISLKDSTGKAELYVFGDNVKISSAPVGTTVTTSDVAGTKVNGRSLSKDTTIVVEERKSSGSSTPETKNLFEILPSDFPTSADSAWVNENGLKAYKDGDNIKVGNLTLGKDVTVTKSGDNYVCKSGDATVTFNVKDGAAESITVTDSSDSNGTYAPAPVISTIADVLATVDEFPTSSDSKPVPAPDAAWVTANGEKCYIWGNNLYFAKAVGTSLTSTSKDCTVEEIEGNYVSAFQGQTIGNITFKMTENVLTEIIVENYEGFNGTYTAPVDSAIDTIADVLKTYDDGFPTTSTMSQPEGTWENADGTKWCYRYTASSTDDLYFRTNGGGSTIHCSESVTQSGSDYIYTTGSITFTFKMTSDKLTSIEVSGTSKVDGTYAPAATKYTVTFDLNGITGTAPEAQTIKYGGKVNKPADPTVDGYTFGGWYKEATCTNAWDFANDTVTANTTLYAKWKPEDEGSYILKAQGNWFKAFSGTTEDKTKITDITFCKELPQGVSAENPVNLTDDSENGKVQGYIVADGANYKIYIVGDYIFGNSVCYNMFSGFSNLKTLDFGNFDTSNVTVMFNMFNGCSGLTFLDLSSFDTSDTSNMQSMFTGCSKLESITFGTKFNTSKVTSMVSMFKGCSALKSLDLSSFDTSAVNQGMSSMFQDCSTLTSLNLGSFDTSNVTAMGSMFNGCSALGSLDLSKFDTSAVKDMNGMFTDCSSLESITFGTKFDTSKVTAMNAMFSGCSALKSLDLSSFDTSAVTNMDAMFKNCSTLESLDLSKFDTSAVTKMSNVFNGCSTLERLDISNFTVGNGTTVDDMFKDCSKLTSVKINAANDKIKTALGEGWTYNGETKAYEKQPAAPPTVTYMDWDDTNKKLVEKPIPAEAIEVTNTTTSLEGGKFYVVKGTDVQTGTLTVTGTGTATLILMDGAKLTATGGEKGNAGINVASGKALIITGQSGGTGVLIANGSVEGAGIGGDSGEGGTITINCGTITATGGYDGAGIGGGDHGNGGNVTINGGTLTAIGGYGGAGIGGGYQGDGGTLTINGGTVNATGGDVAAGIGGGLGYGGGSVTINGGTVTATGGAYAAGIGGSQGSDISGGTVIINGGSVTATGMAGGAGIGGGDYGDGANVTINDGTITATGSDGATAIGKGNSGEKNGTVDFGTGKDFAVKAGTDAENTTDMTEEEYESNHSAKYVKIEESEGK